jgi:hypothetical protein
LLQKGPLYQGRNLRSIACHIPPVRASNDDFMLEHDSRSSRSSQDFRGIWRSRRAHYVPERNVSVWEPRWEPQG